MNGYLKWYRVLSWIGVVVNLGFILPALFSPDLLETTLGPGAVSLSYVWAAAAGMVLLVATVFYMPAAKDPLGYHVYAWLSVIGRALAAAFWISCDFRWHLPGPIETFFVTDLAFAIVFLVLLQLGMPEQWKISASNLSRVFASWKPRPAANGALSAFRLLVWLGILVNLAFALPALFAPHWVADLLGTTTLDFTYLWLGNAGLLLIQLSLFMLPAAEDPEHYHVYAWWTVFGRLAGAVFWLWQDAQWSLTGPARWFWLLAAILAVLQGVALQRGLSAEYRFSLSHLVAWLGGLLTDVRNAFPNAAVKIAALVVAVLLLVLGYGLWANLARAEPDQVFADGATQFKYGAIGLGQAFRVPLYLWNVMPGLCADLLPEGVDGSDTKAAWASMGVIYESGHEQPVGFSLRQIGYPAVEPNCALCHTGSYRAAPGEAEHVLLGAPAHELDLETFQWFLYDCATDPGFSADKVMEAIEANNPDLSWFQKKVYRYAILPFAKAGLELQKNEYAWQKERPPQGRGRTDTFNPTKINVFHLPDDGTIGTVDLPAIWNQRAREGMYLHWDGNNNEIRERNYAAAMAVGATPYSVLPDNFQRVTDYVLELPPPKFPWPVDAERADRGWQLFESHCAGCHAFGSEKVGTVTDVADVGTDRHRLDSFTQALVDEFHRIHEGPFQFDAYRKTNGYSNLPIDGTWARAPYLHNGSVPTLWDLLTPPEQRPTSFVRGSDVYDPQAMGFVSAAPQDGPGFTQDASVDGNGNGGHDYGTQLSDDEKHDLIEYLKTL